ncbi:MAG: hypothetical protein E7678_05625 [Ruminococcaceae bacterium]|nr:hypothetical protein [Oscillospiraceae bacterium]
MSIKELIGNSPKEELDYFNLYKLTIKNSNINLYVSKKRATKRAHIHCTESGDIMWEQFYPFGGMSRPAREKKYVLKPQCDKNAITIVIIRGTPGNITGLDNGIFKSHLAAPEKNTAYLMTEKNAIEFLQTI